MLWVLIERGRQELPRLPERRHPPEQPEPVRPGQQERAQPERAPLLPPEVPPV